MTALAAFPYEARTLDLDGLAYAYVDEGSGPPVVLVHGNPTWSYHFRSLIAELPGAGFRALAPDHIGMGRSVKPPANAYPHTLTRRVEDFGRFLDTVVPDEPVTLVVHDWGGAIALAWAVDHPDRVGRLVLLNTGAFPLPEGMRLPLPLRLARTRLGGLGVRYANALARGAVLLGSRRWLPASVRRGYLAPYDRPAHRVGVLRFVQDIPLSPRDPAYATLARTGERLGVLAGKPVLVCWGMRDFVFDARILARWEQIYPHAEVHRFEDAGHFVLEDAGEQIAPLVLDFLARTAPR
ncbi:MAG: alpha/beta fold hydrolase [Actinomycetota bacterium]|nr:alpha/beta fold hydrolase [Actinomycetota bacterium]